MAVCSRRAASESPITESYVAYWPKFLKPIAAKRGVIVCHGGGAVATDYIGNADVRALAEEMATVTPDLAGTYSWGNDASLTAMTNAFNWLTTGPLGCKTDKVILAGGSMGALTAFNWTKANPTKVIAIHLAIPAVDLADIHDNDRGGYASSVETAYTNLAGYQAAVAAHNPAVNTASFTGIPIRLYYSTNDTIVNSTTVTTFASATGAEAISMGAAGHATASPYTSRAMVDWCGAYA